MYVFCSRNALLPLSPVKKLQTQKNEKKKTVRGNRLADTKGRGDFPEPLESRRTLSRASDSRKREQTHDLAYLRNGGGRAGAGQLHRERTGRKNAINNETCVSLKQAWPIGQNEERYSRKCRPLGGRSPPRLPLRARSTKTAQGQHKSIE